MRCVPDSDINLFQLIYVLLRQYKEKTGQEPLNLSLGNPDGVPVDEIRDLEARFAKDPGYSYHTYAEDGNLSEFAEGMVALHAGFYYRDHSHLAAVPIAGIKTASALIPLACGLRQSGRRAPFSFASNVPAYDIIGTWGEDYLGSSRVIWPLLCSDGMRLNVGLLKESLARAGLARADLVYTVRPGNPAAVGASEEDWRALIAYCLEKKTRLANDAAYAGLAQGRHVPLASIAREYPELEWIEMYSVSKSFDDPGARLGVMVGSRDFIKDYVMIKGNTDSGPVPAMMAAYGTFLKDLNKARAVLGSLGKKYQGRLDDVIPRFKKAGLVPACETEAGFFTLWKVPKKVLGIDLSADARTRDFQRHEAFNRLVIAETGLAGVHFSSPGDNGWPEPFIRYAVCADVSAPEFQKRFEAALDRLNPEYR